MNGIGQRTSVATSGTAFSGASGWTWGYDSLGQVTLAEHGTNSNFHRSYAYDSIGNRQRAAAGTLDVNDTSAAVYTANALNQYSQITNNPITNNPEYDSDGNMTSGPLPVDPASVSSLTWDAENRLISATVDSTTVTYTYDAQSRRIATKVGTNTTLVVYDAWNPIAEWSADLQSASLTKTYTWGMDLSGSMQGAGGVGGLLAVAIHDQQSSIYYPTYDGNVSEYLDDAGTPVAHYEYDPFGRETYSSGPQSADFAHRFSTKPVDLVTGLLYYGYRWYDPITGRWPSRDPIEEEGGINLYGFVGNDGVNDFDYLGLQTLIDPMIDYTDQLNKQYKCCNSDLVRDGRNTLEDRFRRERKLFKKEGVTREQRALESEGGLPQYSCYHLNMFLGFSLAAPDEIWHEQWESMSAAEQNAHRNSAGLPKCWTCRIQRAMRRVDQYEGRVWIVFPRYRDHWVLICQGKDQDGSVIDTATFDIWDDNSIPGQSPDAPGGFFEKFPKMGKAEWPNYPRQICN